MIKELAKAEALGYRIRRFPLLGYAVTDKEGRRQWLRTAKAVFHWAWQVNWRADYDAYKEKERKGECVFIRKGDWAVPVEGLSDWFSLGPQVRDSWGWSITHSVDFQKTIYAAAKRWPNEPAWQDPEAVLALCRSADTRSKAEHDAELKRLMKQLRLDDD